MKKKKPVLTIELTFRHNLTRLREDRGLSKSELARRSGVHRIHLGDIESGEKDPTLTVIAKLADGLGVEAATLFAAV